MDGTSVSIIADSSVGNNNYQLPTFGGQYTWSYNKYFNGSIFAVRLYSRALTSDEIAANYKIDKIRFSLTDGGGL